MSLIPRTTANHPFQTTNYAGDYTDPLTALQREIGAAVIIGPNSIYIDFSRTTIHGGVHVNGVHVVGGLGDGVRINATRVL